MKINFKFKHIFDIGYVKAFMLLYHTKEGRKIRVYLKLSAHKYLLTKSSDFKNNVIDINNNDWYDELHSWESKDIETSMKRYIKYKDMSKLSKNKRFNDFDSLLLGYKPIKRHSMIVYRDSDWSEFESGRATFISTDGGF
jgi:hypothetical protein